MLFEYLKAITNTKKSNNITLDEYIPFLITRWLSFGVPRAAIALNETVNSLGNISKDMHFKLLIALFPKFNRYIKFNYIKRKSVLKNDEESKKRTTLIAQNLELSTREIENYYKMVDYLKNISK